MKKGARGFNIILSSSLSRPLLSALPSLLSPLPSPHRTSFQDCPISLMTGISGTSKTACFVSGGPPDNSMSVYRSYEMK